MVYFTVRADIANGKEDELDRFLRDEARAFWLSQPGVRGFHVYGDALVGWPERTVMVEVEDMVALHRILESPDRKRLRSKFLSLTTQASSQIQEKLV